MARHFDPHRTASLEAGLKTYETGRPCSHGHLAPRYVATSQCVECSRLQGIARREAANAAKPASGKFKLRPRSAAARVHNTAAGQKLFEYQPPALPQRAVNALNDYHKSGQSTRNSRYLDSLIRKIA